MLLSNLRLDSEDLQPMLCAMRERVMLEAAQKLTKHIDLTLQAGSSLYVNRADHLRPWTVSNLEELASALEDFAELRALVIRPMGALSKISSQILPRFTVLHQLPSLVMDVPNMAFQSSPPHLCAAISELIPHLKRLRCRLPRICNDLLESPPGSLEELIINICHRRLGHVPCHCSGRWFETFDEPQTSLETLLVQYAASMRDPKIVRLIHTTRCDTYKKMCAFDAMEDRRLFLGKSTAWDADGVVLPEDWQDPTQSEVELEWEKEIEDESVDSWGSDRSESDGTQDYGGYCDDDSESSDCGENDEE